MYSLNPLISLYPKCPFSFLGAKNSAQIDESKEIEKLKTLVLNLFDKGDRIAMLVIANALQIGFNTDMLAIATGVTFLNNFEEITKYPTTEESRMIAAGIRATYNMVMGICDFGVDWPNYFWNRGLEISPCEYGEG